MPVQNISVITSSTEAKGLRLEYPLPMKPFLRSLYNRLQKAESFPTKKLELDEMGTMVWQCINGKDSTKTIISGFAAHYNITLHEAELSVTSFLVELGKRGLIAMQ